MPIIAHLGSLFGALEEAVLGPRHGRTHQPLLLPAGPPVRSQRPLLGAHAHVAPLQVLAHVGTAAVLARALVQISTPLRDDKGHL
jgi:hypothetical protein